MTLVKRANGELLDLVEICQGGMHENSEDKMHSVDKSILIAMIRLPLKKILDFEVIFFRGAHSHERPPLDSTRYLRTTKPEC